MYFKRFFDPDADAVITGGDPEPTSEDVSAGHVINEPGPEGDDGDKTYDEARAVYDRMIAEQDSSASQTETQEPASQDVDELPIVEDQADDKNSAPTQPTGLKHHQSVQARARQLGVDTSGKTEEVEARVQAAEQEFQQLKDRAVHQYQYTPQQLANMTPAELQRNLQTIDAYNFQQMQARRYQEQHQQQTQHPNPDQTLSGEPDWSNLEEAYGEDDPLVQLVKQQHESLQQIRQDSELRQRHAVEQAQIKWENDWTAAADRFAEKNGLADKFGQGPYGTRLPHQKAELQRWFNTTNEMLQSPYFQRFDTESLVATAGQQLFGAELSKRQNEQRDARIKRASAQRTGAPTSRRQSLPGDPDNIPDPQDNPLLRKAFEQMERDNGSRV